MFKLVVFALLLTACVSIPVKPRHVQFFGSVLSNALSRFRYIGSEQVVKTAKPLSENKVILTFPKNPLKNSVVINSIQHVDYGSEPAQVEIIDGGLGSSQVTLSVSTPKGRELGAEFHFYGEEVKNTDFSAKQAIMNKFIFPDQDQFDAKMGPHN